MNLINGDCLEELKNIKEDSIDLIFCDLPYGQTSCKWDCKIDLNKFWIEVMRIKKLHTPIFFTTTVKFGTDLILSAPKKCFFRYDLVWVKSAVAGFLSAKKMPMRKHEMIYVFYEKLPFYNLSSHKHKFIKEDNNRKGKVYNSQGKESNDFKKKSIIKEEPKNIYSVEKEYPTDDRPSNVRTPAYEPPLPTSMLEIKSTRGKHRTEKPVALMEWILKYYSKEGDTVLDPTMGSGSTGVACVNMNRKFIGIEKDKEIFKVAEARLN